MATGILAWRAFRIRSSTSGRFSDHLLVALSVVGAAIALQLIPLPPGLVSGLSPEALSVVTQRNLAYAANPGWLPLSIAPSATVQGLLLFLSFSVLLFGLSQFMSVVGTRWLSWSLTGLGVVLALIGIIQQATYSGKIYGFWTTQMGGSPFGPFVNRNHFAGWMLMALPMTLALLCGGIARGMTHVRPTWRARAVWFGSRDASELLLLAAAAAVMALSLVLTMSRSGMMAFLAVVVLIAAFAQSGMRSRSRQLIAGTLVIGFALLVVAWAGLDDIARRFARITDVQWQTRPDAWADAWNIALKFPWTGSGLNTYGVATLFFQQRQLDFHYVQAHNDYLQLLAEGGALVVLPAALVVWIFVREVRQRFRDDWEGRASSWWARAGAVTGLLAIGLQEAVDFSLQMPGNGALFAVLCAVALHRAPRRRSEPVKPR